MAYDAKLGVRFVIAVASFAFWVGCLPFFGYVPVAVALLICMLPIVVAVHYSRRERLGRRIFLAFVTVWPALAVCGIAVTAYLLRGTFNDRIVPTATFVGVLAALAYITESYLPRSPRTQTVPNQSSEPTLSSVTSPAGQEPRLP